MSLKQTKTTIEIVNGPVNIRIVTNQLNNPKHGAQSYFFGAVRNINHGRAVKAVSYECHHKIAISTITEIVSETRAKWGEELDAIVVHGTGRLLVEEMSVAIGVSTPHREEAFEACRYIIEELKVRVPIWKQEHYIDGDSEWLKGHELCQHTKKQTEEACTQ